MAEIKEVALMVCGGAVLCAVVGMTVSGEKYEKVIKLVLAAVMLCVIISPLTQINGCDAEKIAPGSAASDTGGGLKQRVEEQTKRAVTETVSGLIRDTLENNGIEALKIEISMDTSDSGSISIGQVVVTVGDKKSAALAGDLLRSRLGMTAEIISGEG